MKEGKYKRFVVDGGYKEVTHHLQVGDYYYADGSVVSGNEAEPAKDNCIGIVCWVGNPMPSVLYKDVAGTPYTATNDALLPFASQLCSWVSYEPLYRNGQNSLLLLLKVYTTGL